VDVDPPHHPDGRAALHGGRGGNRQGVDQPAGHYRQPERGGGRALSRLAARHRNLNGGDVMQISGATALITGGGSGLGAATARALAGKGARVALFDLNGAAAEAVASELGGIAVTGNVASEDDVQNLLATTEAALGAPRILVNCAGIGGARR